MTYIPKYYTIICDGQRRNHIILKEIVLLKDNKSLRIFHNFYSLKYEELLHNLRFRKELLQLENRIYNKNTVHISKVIEHLMSKYHRKETRSRSLFTESREGRIDSTPRATSLNRRCNHHQEIFLSSEDDSPYQSIKAFLKKQKIYSKK